MAGIPMGLISREHNNKIAGTCLIVMMCALIVEVIGWTLSMDHIVSVAFFIVVMAAIVGAFNQVIHFVNNLHPKK